MILKNWNFKTVLKVKIQILRIKASYTGAYGFVREKDLKIFRQSMQILHFSISLFVCPSKYLEDVVRQPAKTFPRMKLKLTIQMVLLVQIRFYRSLATQAGKLIEGPSSPSFKKQMSKKRTQTKHKNFLSSQIQNK